MPSTKPGSRHHDKRLRGRNEPPKGLSKEKSCSFCGLHPSIVDCTNYLEFGEQITTELERLSLTNAMSAIGKNGTRYSTFSLWPHDDCKTLHSGMPLTGKHVVVAGIFSFNSGMNSINV